MIEPNVIVLYVDDVLLSSTFYQSLLGKKPIEESPSFHSFKLSNGMILGLKAKQTINPPAEKNGSGELAFVLENNKKIDELFAAWQKKNIAMLTPPTTLPYGYTFLATDPDGNRLRAVSLATA